MKKLRNISDIPDTATRKTVAQLTIQYWDEATKAAARIHPNWQVTSDGRPKWLAGRKGPRTSGTLLNWFMANHWDECTQIRERGRARFLFDHSTPDGTQ